MTEKETPNRLVSYLNGDFYCGGLAKDNSRQDSGIYMAYNGDKYVGGWKNDKPQGLGVMQRGTCLTEGSFNVGKTKGWNRMLFSNGNLQLGFVVNDVLHGYGRLLSKETGMAEGMWKYGVLHGIAVQLYKNGDFYVGQFEDGKKSGIGFYFFNNKGFYQGQFKNDMKVGYGYLVNKNKTYYSGNFTNDVKDGRGFEVYKDGSKYSGFFKKGTKEGAGIMIYAKDVKYMGYWKNNVWDGPGKLDKQSKFVAGHFKNGELSRPDPINLKRMLAELDDNKVPDNFLDWLAKNPNAKTDWENEFHSSFEALKDADKIVYPSLLKQTKIMLLNGDFDVTSYQQLSNMLDNRGNIVETWEVLKSCITTFNHLEVNDIMRNFSCGNIKLGNSKVKWQGYSYNDRGVGTEISLDNMVVYNGTVTGDGAECNLGKDYKLNGIVLDNGITTIFQAVHGTAKKNVFKMMWGLFYMCGYDGDDNKCFLYPEADHWQGFCMFDCHLAFTNTKKTLSQYFKMSGNDIYGIGCDTVGCYVISGNLSDMNKQGKRPAYFNMTYSEGWVVEFDGLYYQDQINGTWKSSSYTGTFNLKLNPQFNMDIIQKRLKTFTEVPKKYGYDMEKHQFIDQEFVLPKNDINFFVNEEKKMEETVLSYLTKYQLEEDVDVNYEMSEGLPNNNAVLPNSTGSKRNIVKGVTQGGQDVVKSDTKKTSINMTKEFMSCGRTGPDYKFSMEKQYPSQYDNQPFVLEHFEKLAQDGLLEVNGTVEDTTNKGERIFQSDFLELLYPGISMGQVDQISKEQLENEKRKKYLLDINNAMDVWEEFSVGKGTDREQCDALKFQEVLKKIDAKIVCNRFDKEKSGDFLFFDEWYRLMYDEVSDQERDQQLKKFRHKFAMKQRIMDKKEEQEQAEKRERGLERRKKKRAQRKHRAKLSTQDQKLIVLRRSIENRDISLAPEVWNYLVTGMVSVDDQPIEDHGFNIKPSTKEFMQILRTKGEYLHGLGRSDKKKLNVFYPDDIEYFKLQGDEDRDNRVEFTEYCHGIYGHKLKLDQKKSKIILNRFSQEGATMKNIKALWKIIDQDKKGKIRPNEIIGSLNQLKNIMVGEKNSTAALKPLPWAHKRIGKDVRKLDENSDNMIDFEEFFYLFHPKEQSHETNKKKKHVSSILRNAHIRKMLKDKTCGKKIFENFDADGSGKIEINELKELLESLNMSHTSNDILAALEIVDKDKSGDLDYEEFYKLIYGEPCQEEADRIKKQEETKEKLAQTKNSKEGVEKSKRDEQLMYLGNSKYYELAFTTLDAKSVHFLWENDLRKKLKELGMDIDFRVLYNKRAEERRLKEKKRRDEIEKKRLEWERNPPRIPTLMRTFMNSATPPVYYGTKVMDTNATQKPQLYQEMQNRESLKDVYTKTDIVYARTKETVEDRYMWQGVQSVFGKDSLVQFENLTFTAKQIVGTFKRGTHQFFLKGHFHNFLEKQSADTANKQKFVFDGNLEDDLSNDAFHMDDCEIDHKQAAGGEFIRLVGVSNSVDYRLSIQGVIDKNYEFVASLKRISVGEKSMIPDKFLRLSLFGSRCNVAIEVPNKGLCGKYSGFGVNNAKKFFVMYWVGDTLNFLNSRSNEVDIPNDLRGKDFGTKVQTPQKSVEDPDQPKVILTLGSPVSNKETYANMLCDKYKFQYINLHDLVQEEMNGPSRKGAELKKMMEENGALSNTELMDLLKSTMWRKRTLSNVFVVDGHPTKDQWEGFRNKLVQDVNLQCTLYYELDNATIKFRAMKSSNYEKDMKQKISNFMADTLLVINDAKRNLNVCTINASLTQEQVFEESCTAVETCLKIQQVKDKRLAKRRSSPKRSNTANKKTPTSNGKSTADAKSSKPNADAKISKVNADAKSSKTNVDAKSSKANVDAKSSNKKPVKSGVKTEGSVKNATSKAKTVKSKRKVSKTDNQSVNTETMSPLRGPAFYSGKRAGGVECFYKWNAQCRDETEIFQIDQWDGDNSTEQNQLFEDMDSCLTVSVTFSE